MIEIARADHEFLFPAPSGYTDSERNTPVYVLLGFCGISMCARALQCAAHLKRFVCAQHRELLRLGCEQRPGQCADGSQQGLAHCRPAPDRRRQLCALACVFGIRVFSLECCALALRSDLFGELESLTSKIFKLVNPTVAELVRVPLLACDVLSACSNNVALLP